MRSTLLTKKRIMITWNKVGPSVTGPAWPLLLIPPRSLKCLSGKWLYFSWIQMFASCVILLFVGRITHMKVVGEWARKHAGPYLGCGDIFYSSLTSALPLASSGRYFIVCYVQTHILFCTYCDSHCIEKHCYKHTHKYTICTFYLELMVRHFFTALILA